MHILNPNIDRKKSIIEGGGMVSPLRPFGRADSFDSALRGEVTRNGHYIRDSLVIFNNLLKFNQGFYVIG